MTQPGSASGLVAPLPPPMPPVSSPVNSVQCLNPLTDPDWDTRAAAIPGTTFFHRAAWARVLHATYGYEPCYFVQNADDVPTALIAMMGVSSWLTGRRGVSLPFTDECAPLCPDEATFQALFNAAKTHGRARGWKYIEVRGGAEHFVREAGFQPSTSFWGHRLKLGADETALFNGCESSVRRALRKAEQSGVAVRTATDLAAVKTFYGLMCQTRKRHGVPPQSWDFFANIHRHVIGPGHGCVVLAEKGSVPVAGAVYLHSGKAVIYKYGASDETMQHLRANNLVMWSAIKWHAQRGFSTLDFGRTSLDNEGLRRFKLGWGTEEYRVEYAKLDLPSGKYAAGKDRASGWHTRVFQRIPIPIARVIGAALYRHVA